MTDEKSPEKIGVLCPDHGLHYNPETSSGCVLCNREKRSGPARLLILVVLAGVLIGTVHLCLRQEPAAASGSPAASAVPVETAPSADPLEPASARLSPVPYRPQIEELEAVLYRESPPGAEEFSRVVALGLELAESIRRREPPRRAGAAVAQLLAWAARLDMEQDVGYATPGF